MSALSLPQADDRAPGRCIVVFGGANQRRVMLKQDSELPTAPHSDSRMPSSQSRRDALGGERGDLMTGADPLAETVHDQLAREFADIESASAALRRAEPALESWSGEPAPSGPKPRPVWLLIGLLWLSTALVAASAVIVIAALVG
jgi:hypothetical protein